MAEQVRKDQQDPQEVQPVPRGFKVKQDHRAQMDPLALLALLDQAVFRDFRDFKDYKDYRAL
jgi:hypothetical protein